MKPTTILLSLLSLAALPASTSLAQQRVTAAEVAAQVQAFYDQTTTVRTAFTQAHYDRIYRRTTRSRGLLTIARPGKLRFDYLGGDGKVVVSDGHLLTVYEPDDDGGPGQYLQTPVREDASSALGFLTGESRLDRDFRFRLRDASALGWDGYVLELTPIRSQPSYRRVLLFVDPRVPGVVRRVLVLDHDGNLNRFDFQRMRFNRAVAADRFAFTPPVGARSLR
jgi:outer membrane lipoprotein carrier protein